MNQILDYNPNKSSGGGSSGSDKIVRVFAVFMILFALCLGGVAAYNLYKNKKVEDVPVATPTDAKIEVVQGEENTIITVSHDKAIEKLIYSWDSGKENNVKGTGESRMEVEIPLIAGTHTLNVKVIDVDGNETTHEEEIVSETGEDKIYPTIALEVTDQKKLKITAKDETAIDFVTYRWNDGEEIRIDVTEDDPLKIEFEIEILKGKNDLLIVAVDKNNNSTTEPKSFTGVTKPDVTITVAADKKTAEIKCFHENGIKDIKLNLNDVDYNVDIGTETPTDVTIPIDLAIGNNKLIVTATSVDDTVTEATEEVMTETSAEDMEILVEQLPDKPDTAKVTTKALDGIKEIKLNINGQDYDVELQEIGLQEISFEIPLVEGLNTVTLKVVSVGEYVKDVIKEITR